MNVVTKGKEGEREVCRLLRQWLAELAITQDYPLEVIEHFEKVIQRNQNQSSEGGGDINCFGLSIEVKRQETLSIDQWWKQCTTSAQRNGDTPILIYRQNGKRSWHVVMVVGMPNADGTYYYARGQVSQESFQVWFKDHVRYKVLKGELSRV